jgi:hypothetical protein
MTAGKTGRFAAMATFGQRGVEAGPSTTFNQVSQVMPAAGAAEAEERGGLLSSFLKPSEDHLDIDFGVREDYAPGKTLWIAVPLWFFFGGWALHRFYLGHWKYALVLSLAGAMAGFALFMGLASAGAVYADTKDTVLALKSFGKWLPMLIIYSLWVFLDGVYMTIRMLLSGR